MRFFPAAIAMLCLAGCASHEKLPPVAWSTPPDALKILADRAAAVRTVSAQGLITLQRPDGQSVRLDLAMVRQGNDHVRLRAWKLGRAVFDLTLTPEGLWLMTPDDPSLKNKAHDAGLGARKLAENIGLLSGNLFSQPGVVAKDNEHNLIVEKPPIRCDVDWRTLAPQRYELTDSTGVVRLTLDLSNYRMIDSIPFAQRYVATSPDGVITISLSDIELNTDLASEAFAPPHRAEKLP